jgi:hypothetical protein
MKLNTIDAEERPEPGRNPGQLASHAIRPQQRDAGESGHERQVVRRAVELPAKIRKRIQPPRKESIQRIRGERRGQQDHEPRLRTEDRRQQHRSASARCACR